MMLVSMIFWMLSPMDDVIMMSLGLYSNVWLGLIIIGTQVGEGLI